MAPIPDVAAALTSVVGVHVVPVVPHAATVTGVVTEFVGSVQLDPGAHA